VGAVTFTGTLYPFQQEASERMVERGQMLLAMVMGAGKTPTTLSTIEALIEDNEISRVCVVVPSSLKYQWLREIKKFTTSKAIVIDGTPKQREKLWRLSIGCQYVIVNTESLTKDIIHWEAMRFNAMVIDEATIIKSFTSKRSKMLKKLGAKCHYRFALTGQPIENKPEELFSIMQFVDSSVLGKFDSFDRTFIVRDHFGKPTRYRNLRQLNDSMSEAMVRKTRDDIKDQLPEVITQVIPVQFDNSMAGVYERIATDLLDEIQKAITSNGRSFDLWAHYHGGQGNEAQGQIMSRLTVLRMLCDNPRLVVESAKAFNDPTQNTEGSAYASKILAEGWLPETFKTPKLDTVIEYIKDVLNEDPTNKVVLFSFFKKNLRLIQEATKGLTQSVLFMGGMGADQRDVAKQKFATDDNVRLFLSSDAGGYGVDLPQANYLISYDLPWSAGKLDQREARIIRLSSTHPHVTVVSFVMKGSIEERQYEMLQQKREINKAFIDKGYDSQGKFELNLGTLSEFLSHSEV
jgi:SNF2 family DNA or RNA helicase